MLKDGSDPSGLSRPSGNLQSPRPLTRDSSPETTRTKVLTLYSLVQVPGSELAGRSAPPCWCRWRTRVGGVDHHRALVKDKDKDYPPAKAKTKTRTHTDTVVPVHEPARAPNAACLPMVSAAQNNVPVGSR
jgi:hypothetical protein